MYFHVVVWYNPNKDSYYYRKYSTFSQVYDVGYTNQYGHEVILVIDLLYREKIPLKKRILNSLISFLQKF